MTGIDAKLKQIAKAQPYPLLFVTISGAHLYGFPSADSDYDLRGVHVLPAEDMLGLREPRETIEVMGQGEEGETLFVVQASCLPSSDKDAGETPATFEGGTPSTHAGGTPTPPLATAPLELDLVTHDIKMFMLLMLKKNGYVLEQLYSPLVVHTTPEHEELKAIGRRCITRHHCHHYLGFARTQWGLFRKDDPPRVKPLLYVYRVLLTGIHLMRSGEVEANLPRLNTRELLGEGFPLPYIDELVARKMQGGERGLLPASDITLHEREYLRLTAVLEQAAKDSALPDKPSGRDELNDLLLRVRTGKGASGGA